jgi:hypothetical protein
MLSLGLTCFVFGFLSDKTETFWRNEGRVKGRLGSLTHIITCY